MQKGKNVARVLAFLWNALFSVHDETTCLPSKTLAFGGEMAAEERFFKLHFKNTFETSVRHRNINMLWMTPILTCDANKIGWWWCSDFLPMIVLQWNCLDRFFTLDRYT